MEFQPVIPPSLNQIQKRGFNYDVPMKPDQVGTECTENNLDPVTFLVAEALFDIDSRATPARFSDESGVVLAPTDCLVLLAHGSKDPRWCAPFEKLKHELVDDLGPDRIRLAYLEFVGPTLLEVAGRCVDRKILKVRLLPLFMAAGAHLKTDVPERVDEVRAHYPDLEIQVLPPVGEDPRMARLLKQIVRETAGLRTLKESLPPTLVRTCA